ncbi:MAG: heme exporter protein CcmB [Verrucomicrobia bacterium]|nr:heme exporter protein CcmB [Cytophagales bacterium]
MFREIRTLISKEILLELRQKYALNGILLYVVSTVMIVYLSFSLRNEKIGLATWNALFWIILLFTAINAVAKSFSQERQGRFIYYYTLASPEAIIFSKIIYNAGLMLVLALVAYGFYGILLRNPVQDQGLFIVCLLLGATGFSATLTMISGIVAKAGNNPVLMAILSFPVILPMLLMLLKISKNALDGLDRSVSFDELILLVAINMLVLALSYLLFPFVWRS